MVRSTFQINIDLVDWWQLPREEPCHNVQGDQRICMNDNKSDAENSRQTIPSKTLASLNELLSFSFHKYKNETLGERLSKDISNLKV